MAPQDQSSDNQDDTSDTTSQEDRPRLILNAPCRIVNVNFQGAHRTRANLLAKIVADIFEAKTVSDFLNKSIEVKDRLGSLNAFSSIEIDVSPVGETEDFEVTFSVQEKSRVTSSVHTAVDNHSTHLNLQLALPNIAGIGDSIRLSTKYNKRLYSGECRFSVPISPWKSLWSPRYNLIYSQDQWDLMPSGYDQQDKSIINQVEFFSRPQLHHVISFENVWRFIKSSSVRTPIEIREQCGNSVKSSLKHTVTWDNRIGGNFPNAGILASLTSELASNLVQNGARFMRQEFNIQVNAPVLPNNSLICQMNLLGGTLLRPEKFNICDKFFAGGPLLVRGSTPQGIGPNVRGHPLGDMSYLSAGVHLYPILPGTKPESPINTVLRPHFFVNTATIGDCRDVLSRIRSRSDLRTETMRFRDSLRYTCGFGLVLQIARIRLEWNYCIPLLLKDGDSTVRGLQWGFGMTYT